MVWIVQGTYCTGTFVIHIFQGNPLCIWDLSRKGILWAGGHSEYFYQVNPQRRTVICCAWGILDRDVPYKYVHTNIHIDWSLYFRCLYNIQVVCCRNRIAEFLLRTESRETAVSLDSADQAEEDRKLDQEEENQESLVMDSRWKMIPPHSVWALKQPLSLSYLILSYLILSYLILSILSYLILSYLILSYLILSYLILSHVQKSTNGVCSWYGPVGCEF